MAGVQSFGRFAGTMDRGSESDLLGYIKQDIATDVQDLLVMSAHCTGFGLCLPPIGTRVTFELVCDPAVGMLRADEVHPESAVQPGMGALHPELAVQSGMGALHPELAVQPGMGALVALQPQPPQLPSGARKYSEGRRSGVFHKQKNSFGFIAQDSGEAEMFVMPRACAAFGGAFPPLGTRVVYEVVTDSKTGRPRAENCRLGYSGTMLKVKGSFGFIKQDDAEGTEMFVMPRGCAAFEEQFPPIGMRLAYEVVTDSKTGRPRAEDVQPMFKDSGVQLALPQSGATWAWQQSGAKPASPQMSSGTTAGQSLSALQQQVNATPEFGQVSGSAGLPAPENSSAVAATSTQEANSNGVSVGTPTSEDFTAMWRWWQMHGSAGLPAPEISSAVVATSTQEANSNGVSVGTPTSEDFTAMSHQFPGVPDGTPSAVTAGTAGAASSEQVTAMSNPMPGVTPVPPADDEKASPPGMAAQSWGYWPAAASQPDADGNWSAESSSADAQAAKRPRLLEQSQ